MTRFVPNQPVVTADPAVTVDAGLTVGSHEFQLVVVDDSGNRSQPARLVVRVLEATTGPTRPTVAEPVRLQPRETLAPTMRTPIRPRPPTA